MPRSLGEHLFRKLIFATFPHPARLRLLALPLLHLSEERPAHPDPRARNLKAAAQATRRHGSAAARCPSRSFGKMPRDIRPAAAPRRRVGMLTGCVQQVFFPHVNAATARVLAAEGCEVVIPREQGCCGALMVHSGLEDEAVALAKKMIAAFEAANVDTVVINSAGCGSTMKEYGYLLRDDPAWASRAAAFSAKCKDISEIFCESRAAGPAKSAQDARRLSRCLPPPARPGRA